MKRADKIERGKQLRELFENYTYFAFFDFTGINVGQMNSLRSALRKDGSIIKVIKNRIAKKVMEGTSAEEAKEWLQGPTAVVFIRDDIGKAVKELHEFSKEATLKFKGFLLEGKKLGPEKAEELASLPTREELMARIAASMAAPLIMFGRAMSMPLTLLANAMAQLKEKKEKGE